MVPDPYSYLPLAPAALHILLALAEEDRHGYGIMQEVARASHDQYRIGPGTLYENLQKLVAGSLIAEVRRRDNVDPRRRYYRLTSLGKRVALSEIDRLEEIFRKAKGHLRPAHVRKP
jgi:DNA-binding PadR family transcriptional regulator